MDKKKGGRGRRWFGPLAGLAGLTAGAVGVTLLLRRRRNSNDDEEEKSHQARERRGERTSQRVQERGAADRWARPGMSVTFRAEVMPGRSRSERSYLVAELLPNNRVILAGVAGEHSETEFEPIR